MDFTNLLVLVRAPDIGLPQRSVANVLCCFWHFDMIFQDMCPSQAT
jgi:hypothetical protein